MKPSTRSTPGAKAMLAAALAPMAWFRRVVLDRWFRLWSLARLQEATGHSVDASNVIMGAIELHGTRNIHFGRSALIYPGVYLETQGAGSIAIGDGVVLSRGVHIVAFERVHLGHGCMVGEYASIRDANHKQDSSSIRVLMGASIGANSVVGANAVLTKHIGAQQVVGGVPARSLRPTQATPA
jgi:acetyltransferase-like isoleucine patch superfamily enzyme